MPSSLNKDADGKSPRLSRLLLRVGGCGGEQRRAWLPSGLRALGAVASQSAQCSTAERQRPASRQPRSSPVQQKHNGSHKREGAAGIVFKVLKAMFSQK